ncbi:MAG: HepT-like ribonuclease domain-containing protein [Acidimicrobiales bacterium]
MSEHDDRLYLSHVAEAIAHIERSVGGEEAKFLGDVDVRDATLRRLHTIAESTQRLSPELKARHPEMPWSDVAAFRNRIVHGYLAVDLGRAWAVVERDLPPLAALVRRELGIERTVGREQDRDLGREAGR